MIWQALTLQLGYNATLVALGAGLLGIAAGAAGSFMVLRKRALVSDAMSHATLPGIALAFLVMVALGGEGRALPGLILGAALSATVGLLVVDALTRRTRLTEDAAIGAVLSVGFGLGVVLLTVIQTMNVGRQAGLEAFLIGSTAGMLQADAWVIAGGGALCALAIWALRRPMTMVAFDADHAQAMGVNLRLTDLAVMGLVLAVTVIGLRIVGLVLIVALLIIPAVTARFWTDRSGPLVAIAAALGGVAGYAGAAVSAAVPGVPTGPVIVLIAAGLFALSLLFAPARGALAGVIARLGFQRRVHRRQGLLALARGEGIHDALTLRVLRRAGLIRADGVPTEAGRAEAANAMLDEARWALARAADQGGGLSGRYDGLTPISAVFTPDEVAALDARLPRPSGVA